MTERWAAVVAASLLLCCCQCTASSQVDAFSVNAASLLQASHLQTKGADDSSAIELARAPRAARKEPPIYCKVANTVSGETVFDLSPLFRQYVVHRLALLCYVFVSLLLCCHLVCVCE